MKRLTKKEKQNFVRRVMANGILASNLLREADVPQQQYEELKAFLEENTAYIFETISSMWGVEILQEANDRLREITNQQEDDKEIHSED